MSTFKVLVAMVTPPNLRQTPKKWRGHNSSKNDFFEKIFFYYFLVAEYKPVCKIWDLYHFPFFHNSASNLQRIYRGKRKRGHNSVKK